MIFNTLWLRDGALVGVGIIVSAIFCWGVVLPRVRRQAEKRVRDSKDQFIGLASHYLLTPITIIQTAVSRLQEADTSLSFEDRKRLYEAIIMGQQRLWIIAEQLVLINEIDQNSLQLRIEATDLVDVVTGAIAAIDVFAKHKRVQIHFEDVTKEVKQSRLDARRIKQAIIAVLDNAIKFSVEETEIKVQIQAKDASIQIAIEDEGIGMSEEVIRHLSEKFYRGSGLYNFDYEGLGLGLHIAHAIVQAHQGEIQFSSRPKRGTRVLIEFPNL